MEMDGGSRRLRRIWGFVSPPSAADEPQAVEENVLLAIGEFRAHFPRHEIAAENLLFSDITADLIDYHLSNRTDISV
jgi:hypothetical protein